MRFIWFLLCLYGVLPSAAQAAIETGSVTCSDSMVFDDANGINLSCTGDLSFTDGVVSSNIGIVLRATGSLLLSNLSLTAPAIEISGDSITIIPDVNMTGNFITVSSVNGVVIDGVPLPPENSDLLPISVRDGLALQDKNNLILNSIDAGTLRIRSGGNISLVATVPLPSAFFQLILGLFTLLIPVLKRHRDA